MVPAAEDEYFRAYGQFPLVNLFVPFEAGAKQFIPGTPGTFNGSLDQYQALLPPTWRAYRPSSKPTGQEKPGAVYSGFTALANQPISLEAKTRTILIAITGTQP